MTDVEKYTVESLGRIQLYLARTIVGKGQNESDKTAKFSAQMALEFMNGHIDSCHILGEPVADKLLEAVESFRKALDETKSE